MAARGAIAPPEPPEIDLGRLHPQTLAKMCREKHLPDKGSKDVLIGRLQAAHSGSVSRAAGLCPQCGGPKRGRAARASAPAAQCIRCNASVCDDHVAMIDGEWVCKKCIRAAKKSSPR